MLKSYSCFLLKHYQMQSQNRKSVWVFWLISFTYSSRATLKDSPNIHFWKNEHDQRICLFLIFSIRIVSFCLDNDDDFLGFLCSHNEMILIHHTANSDWNYLLMSIEGRGGRLGSYGYGNYITIKLLFQQAIKVNTKIIISTASESDELFWGQQWRRRKRRKKSSIEKL